jgi:hypothetical protein
MREYRTWRERSKSLYVVGQFSVIIENSIGHEHPNIISPRE